jgi:hypothetical protein
MHSDEQFVTASVAIRRRLQPVVEAVCERHARPVELREPAAEMAPWLEIDDEAGNNLVTLSAQAESVNFLLGAEGFLYAIDLPLAADELDALVEDVLDAVLAGRLNVQDREHASLVTRTSTLALRF